MAADRLALVRRYYAGCNTADEAVMISTLTPDVVHYFTHHAPVRGAAALAHYWARMQPRIDGHWTVDHGLVAGDEAVIEWSLRWTPPGERHRALIRGAEWYRFARDLITEIRAYYLNPLQDYPQRDFELQEFPYAARGYPV